MLSWFFFNFLFPSVFSFCLFINLLYFADKVFDFMVVLQQVLCYYHLVTLSVQVAKLPEVHWHTAVFICYLFSSIIVNVFWQLWKIEVMTVPLQIFSSKKIHIFQKTLSARPWKMLGISNVRFFKFYSLHCYVAHSCGS